jgi:hypothetical protein
MGKATPTLEMQEMAAIVLIIASVVMTTSVREVVFSYALAVSWIQRPGT